MKIPTLNKRLQSLKRFLDKDAFDIVKKSLNLPSTDLITKSGNITTSKKKWSEFGDLEVKALESKDIPTLKQLKADARESLINSGVMETLSGRSEINEAIKTEASSMFKVNDRFDDAVNEWYDFISAYGVMLSFEYPEIEDLENELYTKGSKSYMELESWMNRADAIINKALRG